MKSQHAAFFKHMRLVSCDLPRSWTGVLEGGGAYIFLAWDEGVKGTGRRVDVGSREKGQ